jgi:hypothetical protein
MAVFQNPFEKRKVKMRLIFEVTFKCLFLLTQIITGASLHIDEDPREADPLKVWPMLSIKGLTTGAHKSTDT